MTRSQLLASTAAVLTTIAEVDPDPAPEGVLYSALMAQGLALSDYETIRDMLMRAGLVMRGFGPHTLRITPDGAEVARTITAAARKMIRPAGQAVRS